MVVAGIQTGCRLLFVGFSLVFVNPGQFIKTLSYFCFVFIPWREVALGRVSTADRWPILVAVATGTLNTRSCSPWL